MRWTTRLKLQLLLIIDRLFNTDFAQQELDQRQVRLAQLDAQLTQINRQLKTLAQDSSAYQTALYLTLLKARSERPDVTDWLHFVPESDGEEQLLQGLIDYLVKPRLAAVDVISLEGQTNAYAYRLHPDWETIRAHLGPSVLTAELENWLIERQRAQNAKETST
jgi:hypothetical protein